MFDYLPPDVARGVYFHGRGHILCLFSTHDTELLRIDNCDERRVYKLEDISGPKGGTYMFNTSPIS